MSYRSSVFAGCFGWDYRASRVGWDRDYRASSVGADSDPNGFDPNAQIGEEVDVDASNVGTDLRYRRY